MKFNFKELLIMVVLLMCPFMATAGQAEDRLTAAFTAIFGEEKSEAAENVAISAGITAYGALIPKTPVYCDDDPDTLEVDESESVCSYEETDTSGWTREQKAGLFLQGIAFEMQQRVKRVAQQLAREALAAEQEAAVQAAADAATVDL